MIPLADRPAILAYARQENLFTHKQLAAMTYWAQGAGYRRIGWILGITRDSAKGRINRALETMERDALT